MIHLRAGSSSATIDPERGARLAGLAAGGRALIVGPPDDDDRSILWGSFLMAPWCGRIAGAEFGWRGRPHTLNASLDGNAIHGTVWDRAWTVESATDRFVTVSPFQV